MTDASQEIRSTVELLRAAAPDRFLRAVAELERRDPLPEVAEIMNNIRDRIAEIRPPRPMTALRIFCMPFEDMLRNQTSRDGTWIPRAAIQPCWSLFVERADPGLVRRAEQRVHDLTHEDRDIVCAIGQPLWNEAANVLAEVAQEASLPNRMPAQFAQDARLFDYAESMAAACQVAMPLADLKEILPNRPVSTLLPQHREALLAELTRLAAGGKHDLRCILHVVAHWTANPAEIFDLAASLDLGLPTHLGRAMTAQRERVVLGTLGDQITQLDAVLDTGADGLASSLDLLDVAARSLDAADALLRKEEKANGLGGLRTKLATAIKDRILTTASDTLNDAWAGKDKAKPLTRDALANAEAAARAMRKCDRLGTTLGVEATVAKTIRTSLVAVRRSVDQSIAAGAETTAIQADVCNATRILEILEGPDVAFKFYKEKRASLQSAS